MQRFSNVYDDAERAAAYAQLEFPGTYFLAFRDLPDLLARHVVGRRALDFGCGTGRSTRFLKGRGFETTGVDIAPTMIELARATDPAGDYILVSDGDYKALESRRFDVILSAFAFDNIPDATHRAVLLRGLRGLLAPDGKIVLLGSTPEIYRHEWASFTTAAFPENGAARSGETVRIVMKDVPDSRPVVDLVWFHEDYLALANAAGLRVIAEHRPLGRADDGVRWASETSTPPWVIYVLAV